MTVDSFHGVGRGSSNAEERWHHAAQELARARARNRNAGAAVLVEGRRDRIALERFGFTGAIEVLNRGMVGGRRPRASAGDVRAKEHRGQRGNHHCA